MSLSADFDIGSSYTAISWDTEDNDDDGCWDSGYPTRLTVPTGITEVRIIAYTAFTNNSSGTRGIKVIKNGSTEICSKEYGARLESGMCIDTGILTVTDEDYFEIQAYSGSSSYDVLGGTGWGKPSFAEMIIEHNLVIDRPKTRIGFLTDYSIASSTWTDPIFNVVMFDNNKGNCWSLSDPTRLVIPSGYTKSRMKALFRVAVASSLSSYSATLNIYKYGGDPLVLNAHYFNFGQTFYVDTGWISVAAGDKFTAAVWLYPSYSITGVASVYGPSWFEIELAK